MEIEEIAKILSEKGIRYGAITDHVEFDREPLPWVLSKLKIRNLEIDRANELYQEKVEALKELDLDFLMGSIHTIDKTGITNYDKMHAKYLYYSEMIKMIEAKQIDIVGHLDYIDKYYGRGYYSNYQVCDLISAIIENNLTIEINTSSKRRANLDLFPSIDKLCEYVILNENNITIGTDAHQYSELLDNLEQAEKYNEKT